MKTYQWNAKDYHQHSKAQQTWAGELIEKLQLMGDESILDIGCGDGKVTAELAGLVPEGFVLGIDNSASMIDWANKTFNRQEHPNLSFRVVDARDMDFDARFNVVFSNAALHWVKDHHPLVNSIHKSLKPGGKTLLQMGGKGNAAGIVAAIEQLLASPSWQAYFHDFTFPYCFAGPQEYRILLENAGFRVHRVELIHKAMEQDGREGLKGWIRTTWLPYLERIPEAKKELFIEEIVDRYLVHYPLNKEGKASVDMVRLEIEATL